MPQTTAEFVGPKGYIHGWIKVLPGPERGERVTWTAQMGMAPEEDLDTLDPDAVKGVRTIADSVSGDDDYPPHVQQMASGIRDKIDRLYDEDGNLRDSPQPPDPGEQEGDPERDEGNFYRDLVGEADANLSDDENEVLGGYMHGEHDRMNRALREGSKPDGADTLDRVIQRNTLSEPTRVYRGVPQGIWEEIEMADGMDDAGYLSVTTDPEVAEGFGTRVAMDLPAGTNFAPGSPAERELVLSRGSSWVVSGSDNGFPVLQPE